MNEQTIRDAVAAHEREIAYHNNEIRRFKRKLEKCENNK